MAIFPITTYPQQFHAAFEAVALSSGAFYYRWLLSRQGVSALSLLSGPRYAVLLGCIFGAAVGNKLVFWIEMPMLWSAREGFFQVISSGQSMVGGLLGGLIGVELAKKLSGSTVSTGDTFVFPILLGLMIGRLGCFVAELEDGTYGLPTALPWGIDFGDGLPRHPTQLYEIVFAAVLWLVLSRVRTKWVTQPGLMFKAMLSSYLLWRLWVDDLKPVPFDYGFGLSGIQIVCALSLLIYGPIFIRQWSKVGRLA